MYALHHGGPGSSPSTQGASPRLRPAFLILSTLFCAALSQGVSAVPKVLDPNFNLGGSWRLGPDAAVQTVDGKSAVCIRLSTTKKDGDGKNTSKPANLIYQPGIEALKPNTRYSLTFQAKRIGVSAVDATEKLMASVTATEQTIAAGKKDPFGNEFKSETYWPGIYAEEQLPVTTAFQTYSLDFVTPVQPRTDGGTGEVMFQPLSGSTPSEGKICVTAVKLSTSGPFTDGRNEEATRGYMSTVSIRYNTVTAGMPGETQRFVITGVSNSGLRPAKVSVTKNGVVLESRDIPFADVKTDPLTGLTYYVFETKQSAGGYTVNVSPYNAAGASTKPVVLGTYAQAAPSLKRDALHFYYAQRSDQAIVDGRYGGYRNWLRKR